MKTPKHTHGPWVSAPTLTGGYTILNEQGLVVCGVSGAALHRDDPESNADIIADAPVMFNLLDHLTCIGRYLMEHNDIDWGEDFPAVIAAAEEILNRNGV